MPRYDYRCDGCGATREVVKPMAQAGRAEFCRDCLIAAFADGESAPALRPMTRLFAGLGFIMRPSGYNLKPGDAGYADFDRAIELGEVREPDAAHTLSRGATVSSKLVREPMKFEEDKLRGFHDAAKAYYNELTGRHEW